MTAIGEPDLSAALDGYLLECLQTLLEHVHHSDFVCETNNDVEPRRMKGQTECFVLEGFTYVQSLLLVVPDPHSLVDTAGTD